MVHLVEFENIQELMWRIHYYLREENERDLIAKIGYEEAHKKHTYFERAREISLIMEKLRKEKVIEDKTT